LNIFSKYPTKVFSFSLTLRAQALSTFLIGGMRCICCFNCLVAFQSEKSVSAVAVKFWSYVWNVFSLVLFIWSFNFRAASLYLRLSYGFRFICHLQSFRFSLIWSLTSHG
jgi:hypothetical protein